MTTRYDTHMTQVQWRLQQYLQQHSLSAYRLAKTLPDVQPPTIYRLASSRAPQSVNFELLGKVLRGLRTLTGEDVTLNDLLEVTEIAEVAAPDAVTERPLFSGMVHPWSGRHQPRPLAQPTDSTALVSELRGPRS